MKFLHIMNEEKFSMPFIEFISSNYNNEDHFFIITGYNNYIDRNKLNLKNIIFFDKDNKSAFQLTKLMNESDQIIIHGFFQNMKFKIIMLFNYMNLKKVNWIIWGGDLYDTYNSMNIKAKLNLKLKKFLVKRFGYVSTLVKRDYELAKIKYNINGKYRKAMYLTPIKLEFLESIHVELNKGYCSIQIGNSADASNLHFEALDKLAKFKDENIKIYCPLSYGDKEYAKKVEKYGQEIFNEKFIAIKDYMTAQVYGEFLGNVDIAIFNNNRQQALGNVFALAYLGKKIFMRNDTTMWDDLVCDEGYVFYAVSCINNITFDEFTGDCSEVIKKNKILSTKRFDENYMMEVWNDIFK